jgi:hypothetical protein
MTHLPSALSQTEDMMAEGDDSGYDGPVHVIEIDGEWYALTPKTYKWLASKRGRLEKFSSDQKFRDRVMGGLVGPFQFQ